jgi:hypothetical protein
VKSPWKFFVQLTSRGRPAETPEGSTEQNAETTAIESEAPRASVLPLKSTEAPNKPDRDANLPVDPAATPSNETASEFDAPPDDVEEVQAPARDEASQSSVAAPALVPESQTSKEPPRISRTKRPARTKRTRTDMVSEKTAAANSEQSAQSSSSRESFFDEVASLDKEIRQLRSQLAQKLHLQNIQLIKMLERFDIS